MIHCADVFSSKNQILKVPLFLRVVLTKNVFIRHYIHYLKSRVYLLLNHCLKFLSSKQFSDVPETPVESPSERKLPGTSPGPEPAGKPSCQCTLAHSRDEVYEPESHENVVRVNINQLVSPQVLLEVAVPSLKQKKNSGGKNQFYNSNCKLCTGFCSKKQTRAGNLEVRS